MTKCSFSVERLKELIHYDPETGVFTRIKTYSSRSPLGPIRNTPSKDGYIQIQIDKERHKAQNLAWFYMTGEWPPHIIDHRDCNASNNRWSNLRPATKAQNVMNTRRKKPGLKGTHICRLTHSIKWRAQIRKDGKLRNLGLFVTQEEAHEAYMKAARELFGEFARAA